MHPTLEPGDRVWALARPWTAVPIGCIVVVRSERAPHVLVKRLRSRTATSFSVGSDNPMGALDSRQLGSFPPSALVGVVTLIWGPQGPRLAQPSRGWSPSR